jgi:hypothetical protein
MFLRNENPMSERVIRVVAIMWAAVSVFVSCARAEAPHAHAAASGQPTRSASNRKAWLETINVVSRESLQASGSDIQRTPSGMATRLIKAGTGKRHPTNDDAVVLYSQVYDSAGRVVARGDELVGDPARDLNRLGQEAIHMMVGGEVRRFWFPDPKTRGATKVTDYELVWISPQPPATARPHTKSSPQ